jgi:hypothetical protein
MFRIELRKEYKYPDKINKMIPRQNSVLPLRFQPMELETASTRMENAQ